MTHPRRSPLGGRRGTFLVAVAGGCSARPSQTRLGRRTACGFVRPRKSTPRCACRRAPIL